MIGRNGERGSGISVLAARHDDDDDDCFPVGNRTPVVFVTDEETNHNTIEDQFF